MAASGDAPKRVTRRQWLVRVSVLAGGGLLTACAPATPAAPTTAPKPAAQPTAAPKPAAAPKPTEPPAAVVSATQAPAPTQPTPATAGPGTPKRGGKVTWAIEQDPVHLIPFGAVPTANHWGKEFMYDSLLEWDRQLKVNPALAESWEAPDEKTYVFKLRKGVKFHNGQEMTAEDVKYSIDMQENPPAPGIKTQFTTKFKNTEIVDKYTIRMNLTGPDPSVIGYFAWQRYSPVVPKGLYEQVNVLTQGIGTGPFKLVEFVPNDRVVYVRNPDYWKPGLPHIDELTLKVMPDEQARVAALRSGAIDGGTFTPDVVRTLRNDRNLDILKGLYAAHKEIQVLIKEGEKQPWQDVRVRQAVNHAINRQDIVEKVFGGDAQVSGVIPPGYGDWPLPEAELKNNFLKFDVEKAKRLMADAGFANGFEVELQSIANPRFITQTAEVVSEHLKVIGIKANVVPLEIGTFAKQNGEGSFPGWQLTARGMRGDPNGYVAEFNPKSAIYEKWFSGWKIPSELPELLDNALLTPDQSKRHQMYTRAQQILLTELPHITLVQDFKYHAVRNRLKNMYVSYTDFYTGLREVWVEA